MKGIFRDFHIPFYAPAVVSEKVYISPTLVAFFYFSKLKKFTKTKINMFKYGEIKSNLSFSIFYHLFDGADYIFLTLYFVWFGLWHINHCWLSNAKSCSFTYMICEHILLITFLWVHVYFHTVKWFQVFQPNSNNFSCLNFWDEAWWFLSLRVFGLISSSLLLFPQRFGQYVLRLFSGVCRTLEPSRNFELRPLLNP